MKRDNNETFDDYRVRRLTANNEIKQKLKPRLIWNSFEKGTKKGSFKNG